MGHPIPAISNPDGSSTHPLVHLSQHIATQRTIRSLRFNPPRGRAAGIAPRGLPPEAFFPTAIGLTAAIWIYINVLGGT